MREGRVVASGNEEELLHPVIKEMIMQTVAYRNEQKRFIRDHPTLKWLNFHVVASTLR